MPLPGLVFSEHRGSCSIRSEAIAPGPHQRSGLAVRNDAGVYQRTAQLLGDVLVHRDQPLGVRESQRLRRRKPIGLDAADETLVEVLVVGLQCGRGRWICPTEGGRRGLLRRLRSWVGSGTVRCRWSHLLMELGVPEPPQPGPAPGVIAVQGRSSRIVGAGLQPGAARHQAGLSGGGRAAPFHSDNRGRTRTPARRRSSGANPDPDFRSFKTEFRSEGRRT